MKNVFEMPQKTEQMEKNARTKEEEEELENLKGEESALDGNADYADNLKRVQERIKHLESLEPYKEDEE